MYGALKSSITIWTPSWSMVMSWGRRMSSKAMPYCMPEQPPPLTNMRSASWGLPSLERSSLRRIWASEVSETTACSITFWMLPRVPPSTHRGEGSTGAVHQLAGLVCQSFYKTPRLREVFGPCAQRTPSERFQLGMPSLVHDPRRHVTAGPEPAKCGAGREAQPYVVLMATPPGVMYASHVPVHHD